MEETEIQLQEFPTAHMVYSHGEDPDYAPVKNFESLMPIKGNRCLLKIYRIMKRGWTLMRIYD